MNPKPSPEDTDLNREYYEGCARGELRIRRCRNCKTVFRPAYYLCPNCWSDDLAWEAVSGHGTVSHFCVVHQAPYAAFEDVAPYVLALIQLDEGVRLMSNVIGCSAGDVKIGLPVHATFEERDDVHFPMFKPD